MSAYEKLSMKQKLFVDSYFACEYNATEAIKKAGYKVSDANATKMGWEYTQKPNVKAAIDERAEQLKREMKIKPEYLLRKLRSAIERAGAAENFQAELRAIELAMKHNGMFVDKTEISGPDGEAIKMEQRIRENAQDFTSKLAALAKKNVVPIKKKA